MSQIGAHKTREDVREMPKLERNKAISRLKRIMKEISSIEIGQNKSAPKELWNEKRELKAIIEHSK